MVTSGSRRRWAAFLGTLAVLAATGAASGQCRGDFDGDGYVDLAVGVPGEAVNGKANAGAINLFYGGPGSLAPGGSYSTLHQDLTGVVDDAEAKDAFGSALAVGDFNADGFDDLAVGVPNEREPATSGDLGEGAVHVFLGSSGGLRVTGNQIWSQAALGFDGDPADQFGAALATGDFDGNGYDDLIVGTPGRDTNQGDSAGVVYYLRGGASGLGLFPSGAGAGGDAPFDSFGRALAAGDFDGDGLDDLAVAAPNANVGSAADAGIVYVYPGSVFTVDWFAGVAWHQDVSGIADVAETSDKFGTALAAGDFDGDGFADLAVGVQHEDIGLNTNNGAVNVIFGSASGLSASGDQLVWRGEPQAEDSDLFGAALAAGDANGDGFAELIVGAPGSDGGKGALVAYLGTTGGLTLFKRLGAKVKGGAQIGDNFAYSLALGDFDGDGACDLAAGVPNDDVFFVGRDPVPNAGSVTVLAPGFVRYLTQASTGVSGDPTQADRFGAGLSRGTP
jgi:hypothetical protein